MFARRRRWTIPQFLARWRGIRGFNGGGLLLLLLLPLLSPLLVKRTTRGMRLVVTGFTTAPGGRTRFTGSGGLGGGSFTLKGESTETRGAFDMKLDLKDVVIPRANAYLEHFTGWMATRGSLSATAAHTLSGARLDAKYDLVVRGLEVAGSDDRDEVERRVGLPFGLLVSLLKDSRGEIKVSLPVSGNIATRESRRTILRRRHSHPPQSTLDRPIAQAVFKILADVNCRRGRPKPNERQ